MSSQPGDTLAALVSAALEIPTEVALRLGRLVDRFGTIGDGGGIDALVVTDLLNVRYLTGFTGGAATLVVTADEATLVTDGRYGVLAGDETDGTAIRIEVTDDAGRRVIIDALDGAQRVGLEADAVTWTQQRTFADDWLVGHDIVPTAAVVEQMRFTKDAGELARIRAAATLADHILQAIAPMLDEGPTEIDVQRRLDEQMHAFGSEQPAFPTIVASGPNAAMPHHRPGSRLIVRGDLVLIDFGGTIDGYRSDLSRTIVVGEPAGEQAEIYDLVLRAQTNALQAVHDGAAAPDVDRAARSVIESAGRGAQFVHSTGHGVGLYIHEDPFLSQRSSDRLHTGHVVTVEPGVYVPGLGGVRIEDLIVVTDDGYDLLSHTPKTPNLAAEAA